MNFASARGFRLASLLLTACTGTDTTVRAMPVACSAPMEADSLAPSRQAFFREVLFSSPSTRTPRYDDYTLGSYHIEKLDLARGLVDEAGRCGVTPHALIVLGPIGPLWSYHVVAFLQDTGSYQVTSLVMPHARITGKNGGRASYDLVSQLLDSLVASRLLLPGAPNRPDSLASGAGREYSYDFLLVRYDSAAPRMWHAQLGRSSSNDDAKAVDSLLARLNSVLAETRPTYPATTPRAH